MSEPTIVALSTDLMDRSKISAGFDDVRFVRSPGRLREAASEAGPGVILLVDLGRLDDPDELSDLTGRVIAFGSHVDDERLRAAEQAGAEAMPRSIFFRRMAEGSLLTG